jgi:ATP-dependent DNA ligase
MQASMSFEEIVAAIRARRFLPSKPIREIRPIDLQRNPRIVASRKYNGNFAAAVVKSPGDVEFYTSSNLYLTSLGASTWFEEGEWKSALNEVTPGTIFLGELFIPGAGIEDLGAFQSWYTWHRNRIGETPPKAKFLSFDLLTSAGRSLHHRSYEERYQLIPSPMRVAAAPYQNLSEAEAAVAASTHIGCEGFVFWDADASSLCKIGGQNKARGAAWKVKPVRRESFALQRLACAEPVRLVMVLGTHGQPDFQCGSGLTQDERRQLVEAFRTGKSVMVDALHYGYDESGRPEMPRAVEWRTS